MAHLLIEDLSKFKFINMNYDHDRIDFTILGKSNHAIKKDGKYIMLFGFDKHGISHLIAGYKLTYEGSDDFDEYCKDYESDSAIKFIRRLVAHGLVYNSELKKEWDAVQARLQRMTDRCNDILNRRATSLKEWLDRGNLITSDDFPLDFSIGLDGIDVPSFMKDKSSGSKKSSLFGSLFDFK